MKGGLEQGDKVMVYSKKSGEIVNVNSFRGTVTDVINTVTG